MAIYDYNADIVAPSIPMVNVIDFGAKGNGITDDADAIQSALDEVSENGGFIVFPAGTYLITKAILFYSNQTLWFENGAKLLQGSSINNMMRAYSESTWTAYTGVHDCLIYGATFDGGSYTRENTLVGISHAKNIIFENCKFINTYGGWHDLEINSSYNVKVIGCDFEGSRKTSADGELIQIDGAGQAGYYPWDGVAIDGTVSQYIDIKGCIFHDSPLAPAIGNHSNMAHKFARIHDCVFDGIESTRGTINFVSQMTNVDIHDNTFNGCTTGIGSEGATYYIHDNRFVGATTAISGSASVAHANMINGTYTA